MKAIVIMLHNSLNEKIVCRQFLTAFKDWSEQIQIISIPVPKERQSTIVSIERLKAELQGKVKYDDICAFVIESNYGHPSLEEVNFDLFQFGLTTFLNAKIIAYSTTQMSLVMGAKLDDNISVCHSASTSIDDLASLFTRALNLDTYETESFKQRIFTRAIAKELAQLSFANENINFNGSSKTLTYLFNGKVNNSSVPVTHATENSVNHILTISEKPHRL